MGRLLTTKACLHGLSTCVGSTWWQTLARKMQTVSLARGSLVLTKSLFLVLLGPACTGYVGSFSIFLEGDILKHN